MKPFAVILIVLVALAGSGCNNKVDELQAQNTALENSNRQLTQDISTRDEYVDKVADAINDVYSNIEQVRAQEKSLVKETTGMEGEKKLTREEVRTQVIDRIGVIRNTLSENYKKLSELQSKLATASNRYAGLKKMVASLKQTIEERDQSIADLGKRVDGLQAEVNQKGMMITQKDSVIDHQYHQINTTYYIMGTRDQLEKMGIIRKEGGFPWGWFGSTTILASNFDDKYFKPFNKEVESSIHVDGKIEEIVPKRDIVTYREAELEPGQSMLTIAEPDNFWKDKYLVIITDKPSLN